MLIAAALLLAQTAPACAAMDANLPAALAGWKQAGTSFESGRSLMLVPSEGSVRIGFRITQAGTYGIALDQAGWIDLISGPPNNGGVLVSASHGHGPECSTIRKIVRFALKPGLYSLSLTRLKGPARVMLVKD